MSHFLLHAALRWSLFLSAVSETKTLAVGIWCGHLHPCVFIYFRACPSRVIRKRLLASLSSTWAFTLPVPTCSFCDSLVVYSEFCMSFPSLACLLGSPVLAMQAHHLAFLPPLALLGGFCLTLYYTTHIRFCLT